MRLIDKKPLIRQLVNWQMEQFSEVGHEREFNLLDMIIRGIENEPTIEAVPVVRCKDCMYYNLYRLACRSPHLNGYTPIDGYCHNGRKKV